MSAEASTEKPKKSGKKKLLVIASLAVLVAGGGGGGAAWWFLVRGHGEGQQAHVEKKEPPKKPIFVALDPFTVNLQDGRGERMAQIGITLQIDDPHVEAELKDRLPAVRNGILLLISARHAEELLTDEGKKDLAAQVRASAGKSLGAEGTEHAAKEAPKEGPKEGAKESTKEVVASNPVNAVLFSQFIVQ